MNSKTYILSRMFTWVLTLELFLWALLGLLYWYFLPTIEGLQVQRPAWIWSQVGATIMSAVFLLIYYRKNVRQSRFSSDSSWSQLSPNVSTNLTTGRYLLLRFGLFCLLVAIMNPRYGSKEIEVKNAGVDIIVALDVSNSMLAEDMKPNRLEKAKVAINQLLRTMKGNRFGIVVFAGEAYVQLPVTSDYSAAKLFLQNIDTELVPVQGTAIGAAIDLCVESFDYEQAGGKAIIVMTDGENHEDDAVQAAKNALDKGVNVYTIGMGSPDGAMIPSYRRGRKVGFKSDKQGNRVISKLNEEALTSISNAGDGTFTRATKKDVGLMKIVRNLDELDQNEYGSKMYADYKDRFPIFIGLALLALAFRLFLPERKPYWK